MFVKPSTENALALVFLTVTAVWSYWDEQRLERLDCHHHGGDCDFIPPVHWRDYVPFLGQVEQTDELLYKNTYPPERRR